MTGMVLQVAKKFSSLGGGRGYVVADIFISTTVGGGFFLVFLFFIFF